MVIVNLNDKYWPACYRLAKALCCQDITLKEKSEADSFFTFVWSCLKETPVYNRVKIIKAIEEYLECRYYLNFLFNKASLIKKPEWSDLTEHIVQHCCRDLAFTHRDAWAELIGLAHQKLLHVAYYEKADVLKADVETV